MTSEPRGWLDMSLGVPEPGTDERVLQLVALELHQDQTVNGQVVDVHSASDIPVSCTTTPKSWSASMGLMPGEAFQPGAARATAATFQAPAWVAPANVASAVKISVTRK